MVSLFFRIREHGAFQGLVVAVIIASALLIGASTYDTAPRWLLRYLGVADVAVTVIFVIEISIRFIGEKKKREFFSDPWNTFDTIIVAISLFPAELSESVLLLRLVRIFRVLRLVSALPDLRRLIEALILSLKKAVYVFLLMFINVYIYAAFGSILFSDIDPARWKDIGTSAITLTQVMTLSTWEDVMAPIQNVYFLSWVYFFSFIFLMAIIFLNLLIAICVDALTTVSARESTRRP